MLMSILRDWHGEHLEEAPKEVQRHLTPKSESQRFIMVINIQNKSFDYPFDLKLKCFKLVL